MIYYSPVVRRLANSQTSENANFYARIREFVSGARGLTERQAYDYLIAQGVRAPAGGYAGYKATQAVNTVVEPLASLHPSTRLAAGMFGLVAAIVLYKNMRG